MTTSNAYYKRLQAGEGRTAALRQVQLAMLRNTAHSHPYYWASFIQSGAWTNLEGQQASSATVIRSHRVIRSSDTGVVWDEAVARSAKPQMTLLSQDQI
jgi:hypothetical protein